MKNMLEEQFQWLEQWIQIVQTVTFICFQDASWLDGQYTIWGQVVKGMKFIDMIKKGEGANGEIAGKTR